MKVEQDNLAASFPGFCRRSSNDGWTGEPAPARGGPRAPGTAELWQDADCAVPSPPSSPPAETRELAAALARAVSRGTAAWPGLEVAPAIFQAHLGARVPSEG